MKIERGGAKVFMDLGHPAAAVHLLNAELITRIGEIIRRRKDWDAIKNGVLATRKRRRNLSLTPRVRGRLFASTARNSSVRISTGIW